LWPAELLVSIVPAYFLEGAGSHRAGEIRSWGRSVVFHVGTDPGS
jgi:hypothetical protein